MFDSSDDEMIEKPQHPVITQKGVIPMMTVIITMSN